MATEGMGAPAGRSLAKDFNRLMKNIAGMSGGQARLVGWDETDLENPMTVAVIPDSGPYKDGEFEFEITCRSTDYPDGPPGVCCLTNIYHANIDRCGYICLNIFQEDEWSSSMNLEDVVQGILFLMHNPNLDDPARPISRQGGACTQDEFMDDVRRSLDGETVEGVDFKMNRVRRGEDGEVIREDGAGEAVFLEGQPQQDTPGGAPDGAAEIIKTTEQRQKMEPKDTLVEDRERGVTGFSPVMTNCTIL